MDLDSPATENKHTWHFKKKKSFTVLWVAFKMITQKVIMDLATKF